MRSVYLKMLLLLIISSAAHAQEERDLIIKMSKCYAEAEGFSMAAHVSVYERRSDPQPMSSYTGTMQKSGPMYYSEMAGKITLINKKCALMIDPQQQLMIYGKPWSSKETSTKMNIALALDTTLLKNAKVKVKSKEDKRTTLELVMKNSIYDRVELVINTGNYTLEEITYYYAASEAMPYQKLHISYANVKINPKIQASVFSEEKYVIKKGNRIMPAEKWENYRLLDQTDFKFPKYE